MSVVDALRALRKAARSDSEYDLSRVLCYVDALFGRFAPFKAGDLVEIVTDRYEGERAPLGWRGHRMDKGRRGTVRSVDYRDGYFVALVELHDQTWIDRDGQKHPVDTPGLYSLWENDIAAVDQKGKSPACAHPRERRGKDAPCARGGSLRTAVCLDCGAFQTHSHIDRSHCLSPWRDASLYESATAEEHDT